MKKLIIILVVILALILVVGGILIFMGSSEENARQETAWESTSEVTEKEETKPDKTEATEETEPAETVIVTTTGSSESEETEEPTKPTTPASTDPTQPTEGGNVLPVVVKPDISGTVTSSGTFTSSTGAGLDVSVYWQAFKDASGNRKVRLDISLNCYNLYASSRYDGITITLGGVTKTLNTDAIEYTGSSTSILIGSTIMDLSDGSVPCAVSWAFRGTYNDVPLDLITANGTIS